jgi:hypothetical protein
LLASEPEPTVLRHPDTSRPDTTEMTDFNVLTMNSKAFPGTAPLIVMTRDELREVGIRA